MLKLTILSILTSFLTYACNNTTTSNNSDQYSKQEVQNLDDYSKAYFASGCFWCVEAVYESVEGVVEAVSGYSGGQTANPTYESIGTGTTGHAEAVEVFYDASIVNYESLLKVFFGSGDPTTLNRQGPDSGTQYRSIIFYQNEEEKNLAEDMIKLLTDEQVFPNPIVTEVVPLEKFHPAEDYHQDYEKRNPNQPYVRAVSIPRLNRFKAAFPDLLKESQENN